MDKEAVKVQMDKLNELAMPEAHKLLDTLEDVSPGTCCRALMLALYSQCINMRIDADLFDKIMKVASKEYAHMSEAVVKELEKEDES